ncbi:MAG TPA: hypothetical protein VJX74_02495 [Blastocatellia bacterium]|nr:hypothetical protein [Blastocatellia bacterium]
MKVISLVLTVLFFIASVVESVPAQSKKKPQQPDKIGFQKKTTAEDKQPPKRPDELVYFANNIRSAQPEFAADLLIRLAQSDKITDAAWKSELLEEAFRLAPSVQQPFKRTFKSWNPIDTRAGFLGYAFELELDTLSLQCRVIKAMLQVDKTKARLLFNEISKLKLGPVSCEESLIYDVSSYYSLLADIAQTTFDKKEIQRNEHIYFLESRISDVVSPVQIGPVAEAISAIKLSPDETQRLVSALSSVLGKILSRDRAFWFSDRATETGMNKLLATCQGRDVATDDLLKAYRFYLVKQLSGSRCADPYDWFKGAATRYTAGFNSRMLPKTAKNIQPISADEIKPSEITGEESLHLYWQSPKSQEFLAKRQKLNVGIDNKRISDTERNTADWRSKVNDLVKDMINWHKEDEKSEEDYFHQKCIIYAGLLDLLVSGPTYDYVLKNYVSLLNGFDLQRDSRIEWFWQAKHIIQIITTAPGEIRSKLMGELDVSRNPVLYLYTELGRLNTLPIASKM